MLKLLRSILAPILLAALSLQAQNFATITGTITDKSGAAVPGAKIAAQNLDTQVSREVTADDSGLFTLPLLPPGRYKLSVQKQGFRQSVQDGVALEVNQTARFDFQLELGQVSETVEVKAGAPLLDSDNSAVGQVIEQKAVAELPLNGRNFVQLATLGPGVTGVGFGARGTIMSGSRPDDLRPGSEIFANGNREGSNNFLFDGIDNNERLTLSIVLRPSVEAVREFKIQTNLFSADQGRNSGATVNVISKSGSNEWHGSAYNFLRNDATDARNFFLPNKPTLRQNQFGASLGGKIIRDKLFFFGNYEGFQRRQERAFVNSVPTALTRAGNYSEVRDIFDPATLRQAPGTASGFTRDAFPGRIIPSNRFDPIMARMIQAYPLPTRAGIVNNHTSSPKERQEWNQWDGRVDYNINEKNNLFARYSQQNTVTTRPSTFVNRSIPGLDGSFGLGNEDTFAGDSNLKAFHSVINWIRTIRPTFIMEAKLGFNRFDLVFLQEGAAPGAKLGEKLGVARANQGPNSDGLPIFSPTGYTGIGQTRSLPIIRFEDTINPAFAFTNLRGKHTIKFGTDWRQRRLTQYQTNRGNGRFNFTRTFTDNPNNAAATGDAMAALLLGTSSFIEQDFTLFEPRILQWEWNFYAQDDWRVTDKLTINAGIRYEYDTPTREVNNKWTNFNVTTGKILIAGFNTNETTGVVADGNNFAPRLGFAYRLRPGTVLRGGAGIFYNPAGSESVLMRRHRQLPFGPINTVDINQFVATPRRVSQGLDPIPNLDFAVVSDRPVGSMLAIDPRFRNGIAQQYNFQIQQSLPKDMVFKIGYVGNMGRRLDNSYNFNQPDPGPAPPAQRRPLRNLAPNVINVDFNVSDGLSAYHSLQASLERRFASGIGFLSAYTWANSIDTVPNQFGGGDNGPIPQDPRFRRVDRGLSGHLIRQRFVHSMNYELPFGKGRAFASGLGKGLDTLIGGWDMNVIATLQSGLPFTPTLANPVANAGGSRPDRFTNGKLDNRTIDRWFDVSLGAAGSGAAWGTPAQFTYGNASRNPLFGPGRVNFDYSVFKNFALTERMKLQFRTEIFNLFNHAQFDLPNGQIGNPNAGRITAIVGTPRQMQFALRFSF
jgi:outer membrane receptor protein involved in Fe transport